MVRHYTETELREELKKLTVIVDTRENVNGHITKYFDDKHIPHIERKLESGDYSATLGNMTLEHDVFLERKNSLTEICGNYTVARERFTREFTRAKADGAKPFLLIENSTIDDVFLGNYRSQLKPQSLIASIYTWMARYNTTVIFCKPENTGRIIYGVLYYYAREILTSGNS